MREQYCIYIIEKVRSRSVIRMTKQQEMFRNRSVVVKHLLTILVGEVRSLLSEETNSPPRAVHAFFIRN